MPEERRAMKIGRITGWTLAIVFLLGSFWIDVKNVIQGGGIDFRNRITGVRLLEHGIDPYTFKWQRTLPEEYCDPYNNPHLPISKTTASPTLLMVHAPLAAMPYRLAQFLWLPLQWALLLGMASLWLRRCTTPMQQALLAVFVVGFTFTAAWRLHAERGQIYVFLLFLFGTWLVATRSPRWGEHFATGFLAGLLIALRPPFALLLPFLVLHRRGQLAGAVTGLVAGVIVPLIFLPSCWSDYFSTMQTQSSLYQHDVDPSPPPQDFPPRIEGIPTDTLANYVTIPYADFSVHSLLRGMGFGNSSGMILLKLAQVAVLICFGIWLWRFRTKPVDSLLTGLAAWLFLIDLFLPAYRDNYNDVLILNVFALGLLNWERMTLAAAICLLALPLGWIVYTLAPMHNWMINLPSLFLTVGCCFFLSSRVPLVFWRK